MMSYFTNDVDTISDALNNSFAMVIQSFIQMAGTLLILFHSQLAAFPYCYCVLCGDVPIHPFQRQAEQGLLSAMQQKSLGELDGYIEEMVNGPEGGKGV